MNTVAPNVRKEESVGIVTRSPAFREVLHKIRRFAKVDSAVVVLEGETGTGKNYLARVLHSQSPRAGGPFREANLAAMDDALASSELFGHLRGAYTDAKAGRDGHFVLARRGTLFLDELGKASLSVQQKLLRVIETGECWPIGAERPVLVDVRLFAATNTALAELVELGKFLPDLVARLGCFRVQIPALRERREDIPLLVSESLERQAKLAGYTDAPHITSALMDALTEYSWPYNVRELQSVVLRLLVDAEGSAVLSEDLCCGDLRFLLSSVPAEQPLSRACIEDAVRKTGSMAAAARRLSVHRSTLYRALKADPAEGMSPDVGMGFLTSEIPRAD